jgi:hypothetical protein
LDRKVPDATTPAPHTSAPPLYWIEVGEPPVEVDEWRAARLRKVRLISSVSGGVLLGGLAGFAGVTVWPGAMTWSFRTEAGLFLSIAIPVGIFEFFFSRWFLGWYARVSVLHVRRLAIFDGKLHIEQVSGRTSQWPLKQIWVSKDPVGGGWYSVGLAAGRASLSIYVPPLVAAAIATAKN